MKPTNAKASFGMPLAFLSSADIPLVNTVQFKKVLAFPENV